MNEYMLWLCKNGDTVEPPTATHIERAINYYAEKYKTTVNRVEVHPDLENMPTIDGLEIERSPCVPGLSSLHIIHGQTNQSDHLDQSDQSDQLPSGQLSLL